MNILRANNKQLGRIIGFCFGFDSLQARLSIVLAFLQGMRHVRQSATTFMLKFEAFELLFR